MMVPVMMTMTLTAGRQKKAGDDRDVLKNSVSPPGNIKLENDVLKEAA